MNIKHAVLGNVVLPQGSPLPISLLKRLQIRIDHYFHFIPLNHPIVNRNHKLLPIHTFVINRTCV